MSVSDTFGDSVTRIRNGYMARLSTVLTIRSKLIMSFCEILKAEGYISSYEATPDQRSILVTLRYRSMLPAIKHIKRVSKPGCRRYVRATKLSKNYRGLGINVISTSRGVMQSYKAKELGIGGEVLCSVF